MVGITSLTHLEDHHGRLSDSCAERSSPRHRRVEETGSSEGQEVVLEVKPVCCAAPAPGGLRTSCTRSELAVTFERRSRTPPSLCIMKPGQVRHERTISGISSALGGRLSEVSEPGVTPAYEDPSANATAPRASQHDGKHRDCPWSCPRSSGYATKRPEPKFHPEALDFVRGLVAFAALEQMADPLRRGLRA